MTVTADDLAIRLQLDASDPSERRRPFIPIFGPVALITAAGGIGLVLFGVIIGARLVGRLDARFEISLALAVVVAVGMMAGLSWLIDQRDARRLAAAVADRNVERDEDRATIAALRTELRDGQNAAARLVAAATVSAVREELATQFAERSKVEALSEQFDAFVERVESDLAAFVLSRVPKASVVQIDSHR